ncbi:MAG: polysulfide reductase NrfD [Acidobacteria bacterium OLB17]|nr:MAG: polysulfide reductase NrfD [Acidobacteria bacterium OLB17]MCZ2392177.1 polysulfide reductase NrfD [Acidobacteriota bacterium]
MAAVFRDIETVREEEIRLQSEIDRITAHPVYSPLREPLIDESKACSDVTNDISGLLERPASKGWWILFGLSFSLLIAGIVAAINTVYFGIGTWGLNKTVGWAFGITNFVFWIGIGHAGTFISAILYLFGQKWRTSINRSAEAMTLIAVMCAGIFPILHMGRPWLFYWIMPYPNTRGSLWVNFRSPLLWDFFAISTYFTISLVFWYLGLVPDLATARDRATNKARKIFYTVLSLGWNGSNRTWSRYETVYGVLAALATPLVLSVHSIVSFDFATSLVPGWHSTIFPPYFVAGAVFSGFAMVTTLLIPVRKVMHLEGYITVQHLDNMCKITLLTGSIVGLSYLTELFIGFYSGNPNEIFVILNRMGGPYAWAYWIMFSCNAFIPQLFWFKAFRTRIPLILSLCILVNVGMWFERFVIIVTSLHRDYLPSSWAIFIPTLTDVGLLVGSFGLFFTAFLIFLRLFPVISMNEVKGVLHYARD